MPDVLLVLLEVPRLLLRWMVLLLGVHFLRAVVCAWQAREKSRPSDPAKWPLVTVQIPIRNEFYVVERVLRAVCGLDYPRDRLEIQVLDDSDDETHKRTHGLVAELSRSGHDIHVLHRAQPVGYKAGALQHGLESARGEFIAIFDADCVPHADFLRQTIPWFAEPRVGCVQVRWSFLNRQRSLLTRLQAIVLDGLFSLDQYTRATTGLPLQFNGTNGVLRRQCIEDTGGWASDVLAEDADLSFRAQLRGWRIVHRRDYTVPTEVPEDLAAFRSQQRRWALGSAQILRARGMEILRSPLPWGSKLMMAMHLGRHSIDPLILFAVLTGPLTMLSAVPTWFGDSQALNLGLVFWITVSCLVFYGAANRVVAAERWEIVLVPLLIPLAIGLSVVYSLAFLRGLCQGGGAFVRTPKTGDGTARRGPIYVSPFDPFAIVEIALAGGHAYGAWRALEMGHVVDGAFFAVVAMSFAWVGVGSLLSRRDRHAALRTLDPIRAMVGEQPSHAGASMFEEGMALQSAGESAGSGRHRVGERGRVIEEARPLYDRRGALS